MSFFCVPPTTYMKFIHIERFPPKTATTYLNFYPVGESAPGRGLWVLETWRPTFAQHSEIPGNRHHTCGQKQGNE